jgi:hypothetical protein
MIEIGLHAKRRRETQASFMRPAFRIHALAATSSTAPVNSVLTKPGRISR